MSISEARRQIQLAYKVIDNEVGLEAAYINSRVIAHGFEAVVEAIAENRPYDGTLNNIRVPVIILRQLLIDISKTDLDEIGLEDFLISLKARLRNSPELDPV